MDRTQFKQRFTLDKQAYWPCPTCEHGRLSIVKDSFRHHEPFHSRDHGNGFWEPYMLEWRYCCVLECSNDVCRELVVNAGRGGVDVEYSEFDDEIGAPVEEYLNYFVPTFFDPPLMIIRIPGGCSENVYLQLVESFRLFFISPTSAGNALRIAIECLLDDLKVKKSALVKKRGRMRRLTLHERIQLIRQKKYHELKEFLEATKWIGNVGSHADANLSMDDILVAYELFEHVLLEIYEPKSKLAKKAKAIIKRKGPIR